MSPAWSQSWSDISGISGVGKGPNTGKIRHWRTVSIYVLKLFKAPLSSIARDHVRRWWYLSWPGLGKQDVSSQHIGGGGGASNYCSALGVKEMMVQISIIFASAPSLIYHSFVLHLPIFSVKIFVQIWEFCICWYLSVAWLPACIWSWWMFRLFADWYKCITPNTS